MHIDSFRSMYQEELKEAVSAEDMLVRAMPNLAEQASAEPLRAAISAHADRVSAQRNQLKELIGSKGDGVDHTDQSMQAILGECLKMAQMVDSGPLRDAAIISSLQRANHYEIALYGTLATYAKLLGLVNDKEALGRSLSEDKAFDSQLTQIAQGLVNPRAVH